MRSYCSITIVLLKKISPQTAEYQKNVLLDRRRTGHAKNEDLKISAGEGTTVLPYHEAWYFFTSSCIHLPVKSFQYRLKKKIFIEYYCTKYYDFPMTYSVVLCIVLIFSRYFLL